MSQTQFPKLLENAISELGGDLVSIQPCGDDVVYIKTTEDSGCFALIPDPFSPGYPVLVSCQEYCFPEEENEKEEEKELWEIFEMEWERDEWEQEEEDEEW